MAKRDRRPAFERAMDKVEKNPITGCWLWTARVGSTGCPLLWIAEKDADASAARVIYETLVGPIAAGKRLAHRCGERRCVNPAHMLPATSYTSMTLNQRSPTTLNAAKTRCPKGHPYDGENLRFDRSGRNRLCRACRNERARLAMRKRYVPRRAPSPEPVRMSA